MTSAVPPHHKHHHHSNHHNQQQHQGPSQQHQHQGPSQQHQHQAPSQQQQLQGPSQQPQGPSQQPQGPSQQPQGPSQQQQPKAPSQQHHRSDQFSERYQGLSFPFCDDVNEKYERICKIGHGTFGEVHKAKCRTTNRMVALKKVLMENEKEGFPITALREIKLLQQLRHENVIELIEVCRTKATSYNRWKSMFFLVFPLCDHDLAGLLSNPKVKFSLGAIKSIMKQLFNGLFYLHANKCLHRDIKAANMFLTKEGVVRLGDFGLARPFSLPMPNQPNRYTNRVVTLWYRPPELLLGERNYGPAVDMWGAGCVLAEMYTRSPIMQGNAELEQLNYIVKLCGSVTPDVWPGVTELELYSKFDLPKTNRRIVKEKLRPYVRDAFALDLIDKLLVLDPKTRLDADAALSHDFFYEEPLPNTVELKKLLQTLKTSMFERTVHQANFGGGAGRVQAAGQAGRPGPTSANTSLAVFDRIY